MGFEVDAYALDAACAGLESCLRRMHRLMEERLLQAQDDLVHVVRNGEGGEDALLAARRDIFDVYEQGRLLTERLGAYEQALVDIVQFYCRAEEDAMAEAHGFAVDLPSADTRSPDGRGVGEDGFRLWHGRMDFGMLMADEGASSKARTLYRQMVRPL